MSKFKPGDKVTPINAYRDNDIMKQLVGKTLVVTSIDTDISGREVVWTKVPGGYDWFMYSNDLQLVSETQPEPAPEPTDPAPAAAQKPLRRGDLVMCRGQIGVVHDTDPDGENGYWVAALTGDGSCVWRCAEDLTRIGSIRKKVKRLKAAIAKAGGES